MLSFDCKYVFDVASYMKDVYWAGYVIELHKTLVGAFARIVFVYPDTSAFDLEMMIDCLANPAEVSLCNLGLSLCVENFNHVRINANKLHDIGLSIDAASGVAIALREIRRLFPAIEESEPFEDIAGFGGMSMRTDEFMPSLNHYRKLTGGDLLPCRLKHFF